LGKEDIFGCCQGLQLEGGKIAIPKRADKAKRGGGKENIRGVDGVGSVRLTQSVTTVAILDTWGASAGKKYERKGGGRGEIHQSGRCVYHGHKLQKLGIGRNKKGGNQERKVEGRG